MSCKSICTCLQLFGRLAVRRAFCQAELDACSQNLVLLHTTYVYEGVLTL